MGSTGCEPDEIQEIKRQWEGAYNSCVGPPRMEREDARLFFCVYRVARM